MAFCPDRWISGHPSQQCVSPCLGNLAPTIRLTRIYSGLVKGVAQAPDIDPEDINVMFATNVTGLINLTQAVLPIFKKRSDGGRGDILNI